MNRREAGDDAACPVCGSSAMQPFLTLEQVPIYCNLRLASREEALTIPRGDIRLGFCRECGMVRNLAFDPELMNYTQAYENSLHFSPAFEQHAADLCARLNHRYQLRDKRLVEIGCGKGDFLADLCQRSGARGWGFDPGAVSSPHDANPTFIHDPGSDAWLNYQADFVCCRHVLEHIEDPAAFLRRIRSWLSGSSAALYFEVPDFTFTLRDGGIWDIIYEHCSYFTPASLERVFANTGFRVTGVHSAFGGQFAGLEAVTAPGFENSLEHLKVDDVRELESRVRRFAEEHRRRLDGWAANIGRWFAEGRRPALWGAGSKGVTFLNTVAGAEQIEAVVDVSPRKLGTFIPGTGQKIGAPEVLRDYRPDIVLVMNPLYLGEIEQTLGNLGVDAETIAAS